MRIAVISNRRISGKIRLYLSRLDDFYADPMLFKFEAD